MKHRLVISALILATVLAAGCRIEPPLYLRTSVQSIVTVEAEVNVNLMWQVGWDVQWTYHWDAEVLGPVGYKEEIEGMSLHIFPHNDKGGHLSHTVKNFVGSTTDIPFIAGIYDLLFHNNDSEVLLFREDEETDDIYCYTSVISSGLKNSDPVKTMEQKLLGTKASGKAPENEPVARMPDDLFSLYDKDHSISENLADYEYVDGKYVILIKGELTPASYIHLVQVNLKNNDGRIIGSGGAVLTGVADGVNLMTKTGVSRTVSVPTDVALDAERDMLGMRFCSFGIPGCNPYEADSVNASTSEHCLVMNVLYANNSYRNISVDLTEQIHQLPLGGVIVLDLDVNDFPPGGGEEGGGGFDALISDWNDITGEATITY